VTLFSCRGRLENFAFKKWTCTNTANCQKMQTGDLSTNFEVIILRWPVYVLLVTVIIVVVDQSGSFVALKHHRFFKSVCGRRWSWPWVLQKRMNQSRCRLGSGLVEPRNHAQGPDPLLQRGGALWGCACSALSASGQRAQHTQRYSQEGSSDAAFGYQSTVATCYYYEPLDGAVHTQQKSQRLVTTMCVIDAAHF